jgi:hypothetical protein
MARSAGRGETWARPAGPSAGVTQPARAGRDLTIRKNVILAQRGSCVCARTSCPVPGLLAARRRSQVRARTTAGAVPGTEGRQPPLHDLCWRARRRDPHELAPAVIVLGQGPRAGLVGPHPNLDGFGPIVLPLHEPAAALVADALGGGRPRGDVVDRLAARAGAATAQADHHLLQRGTRIGPVAEDGSGRRGIVAVVVRRLRDRNQEGGETGLGCVIAASASRQRLAHGLGLFFVEPASKSATSFLKS